MITSKVDIWIAKITILLAWILIIYQVPSLITHQSRSIEIFGRYSLWYFVILMVYLGILLTLTIVGIWLVRASREDDFVQQFQSFFSERENLILVGSAIIWILWVIINQTIFIPAKVYQGVSNSLLLLSLSLILIYTPQLTSLNLNFIFSQVLIPLGVLSIYFLSLSFSLPDGVNQVFVKKSAIIFVPLSALLFILYFSFLALRKTNLQVITDAEEKFSPNDLVLPLLPLTPVIQYLINNSEILSWFEGILILFVFYLLSSVLIIGVPLLFKKTGSTKPLKFLGLAFSFLIFNMASLTAQYKWYQEGSLEVQLLILGGVWLLSWILSNTKYQTFLYLLIAVHFISNSIVQLSDRDIIQSPPSRDQSENMLIAQIGSREPLITPSIYLLVYDSYISNETMLAHGIDNLEQQQKLEELGFKIYPKTYSIDSNSIASMSRVLNVSVNYYGNIRRGVSGDGVVHNMLEDFGYRSVGIFPRDFFFRGIIPGYDFWYPGASSSAGLLIKAIFVGELRFDLDFDEVPREDFVTAKRNIFAELDEGPRFVYTHSNLPGHSFNSGVCRPDEIEIFDEKLSRANIEMNLDLELVLKNNPKAIVIVAGDHGPYLTKNCFITGDQYDISEINRLDIQDRNGTFLAIRWPTPDFEEYDEITVLQDLFPAIFAYLFEDQGLLDSRIDPTTVNGMNISGAEVSNGIIMGGANDGEPLFLVGDGD